MRKQLLNSQSTSFLAVIESYSAENVGKYTCTAENDIGTDRKDVSLSIKVAPTVSVEPRMLHLKSGEKGTIKCHTKNVVGAYKIYWINEFGQQVNIVRAILCFVVL